MKPRLISILLFISFLICYIQFVYVCGFIFQLELGTIILLFDKPDPYGFLFLIPIIGHLLLLVCAFIKKPNKLLTVAIIMAIPVVLYSFIIGVIAFSYINLISSMPFLTLSGYYFVRGRKTSAAV